MFIINIIYYIFQLTIVWVVYLLAELVCLLRTLKVYPSPYDGDRERVPNTSMNNDFSEKHTNLI